MFPSRSHRWQSAIPAFGTFGNVTRDKYHGPGVNHTNLVLAKNFILSADGVTRLQLRMESDNVFNHTQFLNPNGEYTPGASTSSSATFGQISAAAAARLTQIAAKIYF
jgi:hypothetical protein